MRDKREQPAEARKALAGVAPRLAGLTGLSVAELREEFLQVYGFPTRSRNRDHLLKRVAWKIQADAEGGLSQRALDRIEQLAPLAPIRWRPSLKNVRVPDQGAELDAVAGGNSEESAASHDTPRPAPPPSATPSADRDARLPPVGTMISREYRGLMYHVRIMRDGFEYDGGFYNSLSKVAAVITGTNWNGYLFFKTALERARRGRE